MIRTGFCVLGAALALGTAVVWSWQPASLPELAKMDETQRSEYLSNLEASDVVGYYCNRTVLPANVQNDVIKSLRQDYGVDSVGCGANEKIVPVEEM